MAELTLRCSAGTYVRSLARDLGTKLGCGAYLGALRRTASGPFDLDAAHPLERVREELAAGRTTDLLLAPDAGLDHIPLVRIPERDREALARGQIIRVRGDVAGPAAAAAVRVGAPVVRVTDDAGRLVAMAHVQEGRLYPDKVFITPGASSGP
jgi:tRNA pseudouridine55 synthase